MNGSEVRERFLDYFARNGHLRLPSGPLVPPDDPTLMFTNAGMVQFKRFFLGEDRPDGPRAVTSQKCLRVSGKHNDLEEVGRTARHHTFFEMLGNFSFGDYFKREAIAFAWEFVTDDLGMDPERIWATVHHSDDEAFKLWSELTPLTPARIRRLGDKDNFWQMGDTGPCGPCSELHYDLRQGGGDAISDSEFEAAGEADQFIEIWNLVFMQFNRDDQGRDTPLPAPSIDTGAGLERIAAILQGVGVNYHTDLFMPVIDHAADALDTGYSMDPGRWEEGLPLRVLADHSRAVAFLLADGVFPSNEKRGYVLRRILRRGVRQYWMLGRREPLMCDLVKVVADLMSSAYPELARRIDHILDVTRAEEEMFLSTIDAGMREIDAVMPAGGSGTLSGQAAFRLKDTHGIPEDLTALIGRERGYSVDWAGFQEELAVQRARSRAAGGTPSGAATGGRAVTAPALRLARPDAAQEWVGYDTLEAETSALEWESDPALGLVRAVPARNPFYREAGGQVSDRGRIAGAGWEARVSGVAADARGRSILEAAVVTGEPPADPGDFVASVDRTARRATERNHSATHLLHASLRDRLGTEVQQAGSLVAPDRLRFDFTHRGPVTPDERADIESQISGWILENPDVEWSEQPYETAIASGAMALFGEKYGDTVRVVDIPGVGAELCGGTHVRTTGQIGSLRIVAETGVASGVRRIEAITGHAAFERAFRAEAALSALASRLRTGLGDLSGLEARLEAVLEERDRLRRELAGRAGTDATQQLEDLLSELAGGKDAAAGPRLLTGTVRLADGADPGELADGLRKRLGSGAGVLYADGGNGGRRMFLAVVSDDLIKQGLRAGDLVKAASSATGSGGGGRPHFAQGGVGDAAPPEAGLAAARELATGRAPALDQG